MPGGPVGGGGISARLEGGPVGGGGIVVSSEVVGDSP